MIIKGGSRAAPRQLARHLQRGDTNERVEIIELQSPVSDLFEAFRDWQTLAEGTRGDKGLYHANIAPDTRYTMTREQWQQAVDTLEKELGFTGQPRAVILHEKNGREHIHVVWQRTNIDTMTLVSDSNNYRAHERASMALEQAFGHEHVPGKHAKRNREQQQEFPKAEITHAEWQQADRTGIDPRELKELVTGLYRQSDNPQALKTALADNGFIIAKGDRRDYVIVDETGEVHSLARQIKDVTAKDLRQFMAVLDPQTIPNVEQAKALQREQAIAPAAEQSSPQQTPAKAAEPPQPQPQAEQAPKPDPSKEERERLDRAIKARHEEETRRMHARQQAERDTVAAAHDRDAAAKVQELKARQQAERVRYDAEHNQELRGFARFVEAVRTWFNPAKAAEKQRQKEQHRAAFLDRQAKEVADTARALNQDKAQDLTRIAERHAQQQREHAARYAEERDRYMREQEAARRLLEEMEEQRRQRQRAAEQQRSRDGPPDDRAR